MLRKLTAVGVVISAAVVTNIPSTSYAFDFREKVMWPVVKKGCSALGGPMVEAGCVAVHEQGKDGFKAARYPAPQQPPPAYQPQYQPPYQPQYQQPLLQPQYQPLAYQPQYQPQPIRLGTVCAAPNGWSGQGSIRPLGAYCQLMTPYGVIAGQIVQ